MPRTAPTVNGTPATYRVSFQYVDADGKPRADVLYTAADTTDAQIEAYAVAMAAITNSVLWNIEVAAVYSGSKDTSLANNAVHVSVKDAIVYHMKATPTDSQRVFVPAPVEAVFNSGTNTPDIGNASLSAAFVAGLAVVNGTGSNYDGVSARFTQGRQINQKVNT